MNDESKSKEQLIRELAEARDQIAILKEQVSVSLLNKGEDHKLDETSLVSINCKISDILESIQDCFLALDRKWRFTYVNKRAAQYLGMKVEDLLGRRILEVFPQFVGKDHELYGRKAMEERKVQRFTVKGDLTNKWLSISIYPSGEGISVYWQDITEQKKMDESLRLANERLDMAQMAAESGSWDWDIRTGKIEGTPQMFNLAGLDPDKTLASIERWEEILHPEDRDAALSRIDQALKDRSLLSNEYRIIRPDGQIRWIAAMGRGYYDDQGRPFRMMGICLDVTDRKRAEEELRKYRDHLQELVEERTVELEEMNLALKESEAKYRFLTEKMSDTIWITDERFNVTYISPSIEWVRGFKPEEVMEQRADEYLTPDSYAHALDLLSIELERNQKEGPGSEKPVNAELEFRHKDGSTVWMESVMIAMYDGKGNFTGVHGVGRDITERKRAEAEKKELENQLIQMQRIDALHRFAGGIAHDLNNILYPVIINTEQLLLEAPTESEQYEILNQTLKASYRQRDLIKKILTFSRKYTTNFSPIKVKPLLEEAVGFIRASLPSTIEIHYSTPAKTDVIMGDPIQIQQVVLNLCQNAAEAMISKMGKMIVRLSNTRLESMIGYPDIRPGKYLVLTVKDNGSGMNPEVTRRIFEPFFTTKEKEKGTGMGLSVAYGIVASHKGAVTVRSKEGKGSLFTVFLPTCDEECEARACFVERTAPASGKGRILLVDDEEAILNSLERTLKSSGYRVAAFQNGHTALELFERMHRDFDLVITDLTMPGMTGLDLSRKIRGIRSDIPIILCTGHNDAVDPDKARSAGIREMLMKPAGMNELKNIIHRALEM